MYTLRKALDGDYDFLYNLNKTVMKEYEEKAGGWDEEYQQKYFREHFAPSKYEIIKIKDKDAGTVSLEEYQDSIHICEIQILPQYQNLGIGTSILKTIIARAKSQGMSLSLGVPKPNLRAITLYKSLGFLIEGETKSHYLMTIRRGNPAK